MGNNLSDNRNVETLVFHIAKGVSAPFFLGEKDVRKW